MAQHGKRAADGVPAGGRRKLRAADVTIVAGSRSAAPSGGTSKLADVVCSIAEYSKCAADFGEHFGQKDTLWQLQLVHDARPSVTFDILRSFPAFMVKRRGDAGEVITGSFEEIERKEHVRLVITGNDDPDQCAVQAKQHFHIFIVCPSYVSIFLNAEMECAGTASSNGVWHST